MQPVLDNRNPESATGTVGFEKLAIALFTNQLNPSIINLAFLKISGIKVSTN